LRFNIRLNTTAPSGENMKSYTQHLTDDVKNLRAAIAAYSKIRSRAGHWQTLAAMERELATAEQVERVATGRRSCGECGHAMRPTGRNASAVQTTPMGLFVCDAVECAGYGAPVLVRLDN
jgi:hypothetical protein